MPRKKVHSNTTVKHDFFPYDVSNIFFTRYSHWARSTTKENKMKQKNLIIGSSNCRSCGLYEFVVNNETNSIEYESLSTDYNKKFANLEHIGYDNVQGIHSYLIRNNKYLVVFDENYCYNVYDMSNDKWLLDAGDKYLSASEWTYSRSVLINDDIIIISQFKQLYFYFIGNNHIVDPILIRKYKLKTHKVSFNSHAMCIIDFTIEKHGQYKLKIMLFGGRQNEKALSSFLILDISLSYYHEKFHAFKLKSLSIKENLVNKKKIQFKNMAKTGLYMNSWFSFGFECILNSKNEPIVVMIGGYCGGTSRDIHLFNCVTNELRWQKKVEQTM